MNAVGLALSAANPGLLGLAALSDSDRYGGRSYSRRPVRYESDEETLQRVERAQAERERKAAEVKRWNAWCAIPGNEAMLVRQKRVFNALHGAYSKVAAHNHALMVDAKLARKAEARAQAQATVEWIRNRYAFVITSLVVLTGVVGGLGWFAFACAAGLTAWGWTCKNITMDHIWSPIEDSTDLLVDLYISVPRSAHRPTPFGRPGPDFNCDIDEAEARTIELVAEITKDIPA